MVAECVVVLEAIYDKAVEAIAGYDPDGAGYLNNALCDVRDLAIEHIAAQALKENPDG